MRLGNFALVLAFGLANPAFAQVLAPPSWEVGQAELKMISYIQANSAKCGIPPQIADQLKNGHKNTEKMQTQVCNVAQQAATRGPAGPSLSEVLGSSSALPEAQPVKKGGSTFDTLNGNVLTR